MSSQGSISTIKSDSFVRAVADAIAQPGGELDQLVRAYYASPRVRRLIMHACFINRINQENFDEIRQDLAILLTRKFLSASHGSDELYIRDPDKIYNVLHVSACNLARRRSEKMAEVLLSSLTDDNAEDGDSGSQDSSRIMDRELFDASGSIEHPGESTIDHAKAVADFNRRFEKQLKASQELDMDSQRNHHLFINPQRQQVVVAPLETRSSSIKEPVKVNTDAVELRKIMERLDWTIPEMAAMLNLSKGKFNSYLYGMVKNIPSKVMAEARVLMIEGAPAVDAISMKFEGQSMEAISDNWMVELRSVIGNDVIDDEILKLIVSILGVDRATFWRWRNSRMRPRIRQLNSYDEAIKKYISAHKEVA